MRFPKGIIPKERGKGKAVLCVFYGKYSLCRTHTSSAASPTLPNLLWNFSEMNLEISGAKSARMMSAKMPMQIGRENMY